MQWFVTYLLITACCTALAVECRGEEPQITQEEFTFSSSLDATGPLCATAVYPQNACGLPMMVVQHGYNGKRDYVLASARRFAQAGFFCVCISLRGRDASAGIRDDGGIEIMDIYDGIKAAEQKFGGKVDADRVSIVGYSNGGANVFFAAVRFPYMFQAAMAMFGISDYGMWAENQPAYRDSVIEAVGGTPDELPDAYLVRNANLAAGNLSGTRFHIAYDEEETTCPPALDTAFVAAAKKADYRDIFVHVSRTGDANRWLHGYNDNGHLSPIEDVFINDILRHQPPKPVMPPTGELVVLGFVVTPRFTCILGEGDDAAARLNYDLRNGTAKFSLSPLTSNKNAKAVIILQDKAECDVEVAIGCKAIIMKKGQPLKAEATIDSAIEFKEKK